MLFGSFALWGIPSQWLPGQKAKMKRLLLLCPQAKGPLLLLRAWGYGGYHAKISFRKQRMKENPLKILLLLCQREPIPAFCRALWLIPALNSSKLLKNPARSTYWLSLTLCSCMKASWCFHNSFCRSCLSHFFDSQLMQSQLGEKNLP